MFGVPKCFRKKIKVRKFKINRANVKKIINIFITRWDKKVPLAVLVLIKVNPQGSNQQFKNPLFGTGSFHKRQKPQAPTPQAPTRNHLTKRSQTPKFVTATQPT